MEFSDTEYFFEVVNQFDKVLPKDLRKIKIGVDMNQVLDINSVIEIINYIFFDSGIFIQTKDEILIDLKKIIEAIFNNEDTVDIKLISKSRFSLVFKIGTKVFKVGFPKIIYKYPKSTIVLDSIIRKQYFDNYKPVLFVEVQDFKENDLYKYYAETDIEEILYSLWKKLREIGIVWYDPKDKNIVINTNESKSKKWNDTYYIKSNENEKGIYIIDNYIDDIKNDLLIVDTDLFLPIEVIEKVQKINQSNPNLPFFKNWKYKKFLEYETRFLKEQEYDKK